MVSARKIASAWGSPPKSLHRVKASLGAEGNPWGEERQKRLDWAKDLSIKTFTEGTEILYFPCCLPIYDPRLRKVAHATVSILKRAGVDFGLLGLQENCCGESIRRAGEEELFGHLALNNIKSFIENGVKRILVSSPHCYHSFKNEYPEFGDSFEVVHISQYLAELVDAGRLTFSKEYRRQVVYHDPCYLGRHNDIYDEPREILKRVPYLELVEFAHCREDSFCCGGGGARIWMETPKGQRFSDIRLEQAMQLGAEVLATSCPYCILNFETSRLALEDSKAIEIKDITEIIYEAIDESE